MIRKIKKNLISLFMLFSILFSNIAFAWNVPNPKAQPPTGGEDIAKNVTGFMRWIGIIVAVVMVIYVGIKYLTAGAGTKATVKSDLLPMLIGVILIAATVTIVDAVFNMMGGI